jgi:rfaE bifunctional protein kinase chain/domain
MLKREAILASLESFKGLEVLVVGDLFLDEYVDTTMVEISREGPIPVLRHESMVQTAGAAGNLAASIAGLGAKVSLVAVVGRDPRGQLILDQLAAKGIEISGVVVEDSFSTLTYTKIRSKVDNSPSQELFRIDVLPRGPLSEKLEATVLGKIESLLTQVRGVILLDQVHQLVAGQVLRDAPRLARKSGALVQGSSRDHIGDFRGFDCINPNDREASEALGGEPLDIRELGFALKEAGRHRRVMLTLGAEGMALFPERGAMVRLPTYARQVVDVTGAGDSVSSVALLGQIVGWDLVTVGWVASVAAGLVVAHVGTHHLSMGELRDAVADAPLPE